MSNPHTSGKRTVEIDFQFIDLTTCTRCLGTEAHLHQALDTVTSVLGSAGVEVLVRKTLVDSEEKALELGFVSSPTLRVNGRDIALELRESACNACGDACGGSTEILCRDWAFQGQTHDTAPVPLIVDAILSEVYRGSSAPQTSHPDLSEHTVPENLKTFFAHKRAAAPKACCGTVDEETACTPSEKPSCCGAAPSTPSPCGCR